MVAQSQRLSASLWHLKRQNVAYVRRQTQTVNYSATLPLAQGVKFDVD
jgi:hypothetical protein